MKNKLLGYLCAIITTSAWGSVFVISKHVLGKVPAFTLLFLRYFVGAVVLFAIMQRKKRTKIGKKDYKYIFLIGFLGYFVSIGAQFIGTDLAGASLASLINSMNPVFIIMFAMLILKERFTLWKAASLTASITGVYIVLGGVSSKKSMTEGIIVSIFAGLTWSLVSVVSKKVSEKYDAVSITAYALLVGMFFTFPVSIYELLTTSGVNLLNAEVICSVLYMGIISTAIALACWNKALSLLDAGICSLFYPVMPMVSVLLGSIFLKERMNESFFIGAVLIIGGVLLSVTAGRKNTSETNRVRSGS